MRRSSMQGTIGAVPSGLSGPSDLSVTGTIEASAAAPKEEHPVSRVPRSQEHLKTGFTSEAASAARFRAYAARAEREERPNLARAWLDLAADKDRLAILLLEAAGKARAEGVALSDELAEEQFENDVLYPKMMREVDSATAGVFQQVVAAQKEHVARLDELRRALQAAAGDIA
jgi:rubrerythrin